MKRLRYLRQERGLTQEQLAVYAGVGLATVSSLERGKRDGITPVLRALASELRYAGDPERLLDDIPDTPQTAA